MSNRFILSNNNFEAVVGDKKIGLYALKNESGSEVYITNYGGIIVSLWVPDKNGVFGDVVLGHDSIKDYLSSPEPTLGSLIGRYGNRIAGGHFTLDGKTYNLAINNGPNNLHGGIKGFNHKVWTVANWSNDSLELVYVSVAGEEGFPGNLKCRVVYNLTSDNTLSVEYFAETDATTPINLTQHSYFNLQGCNSGEVKSTMEHKLMLNADFYLPINDVSIPLGTIDSVKDTPFDFTKEQSIGQRIDADDVQLKNGKGYDHCFVVRKKEENELVEAAYLYDPCSGRTMQVYTTEPGVQLYTANWLNVKNGKYGCSYGERCAVCLETQKFPDTPNHPYFPSALLYPGQLFRSVTMFKFGIK